MGRKSLVQSINRLSPLCLSLLDGKEGDASVARLAFEEAADEAESLVVG
jgi:hypothetical protein